MAAANAPDLTVVAGPATALAQAARLFDEADVLFQRLPTSHAFHTAAMEPAVAPFASALAGVTLRAPAIPLVGNLTGDWVSGEEARDATFWARQIRLPVRFSDGVRTLLAAGHRHFLEIGPGGALSTMVLRHGGRETPLHAFPTLPVEPRGGDQLQGLLQALGNLWSAGAALDWPSLWPHGTPRRVGLPPYPFERRRHWVGAAAPAPVPAKPQASSDDDAAGGAEQRIVAVWRRLLGHEEIGLDDDFHRLGGDSLLAVRVAAELRRLFDSDLQPHELLAHPTPRRLARRLERTAAAAGEAAPFCRLVLREGRSDQPPLLLFHAVGGTVNFYGDLIEGLDPGLPVVAFQSASLDGRTPADPTVETMVERYLAALSPLQRRGPYRLVGSSFGGMVAFEAARQLAARGESVQLVAMLDTPGPGDYPRAHADDAEVLSYIATLLEHPIAAEELRELGAEAQLARFIARAAPRLPPGITPAEFAVYLAAFKSNTRAMRAYAPPPWQAPPPVLFVKAATRDPQLPTNPERAWQRLLPADRLTVETVPGAHLSMLAGATGRALGRRLMALLGEPALS